MENPSKPRLRFDLFFNHARFSSATVDVLKLFQGVDSDLGFRIPFSPSLICSCHPAGQLLRVFMDTRLVRVTDKPGGT